MIHYDHPQVQRDLAELLQQGLPWEQLRGQSVLVTGTTGMLGSYMGFSLLYLNTALDLNIHPIFLARSQDKLTTVYGEHLNNVECLLQDVTTPIQYDGVIDYIFHAAGAASPYHIVNDPIGIIDANVLGTRHVLDCARTHEPRKVLFTSTREVYGKIENQPHISENDMGATDPMTARSCYPESKRMAETLLKAYQVQHGVRFNSLRIAHTYGPGMRLRNDGRVMADFMRDAVEQKDIQLKSAGTAIRAFCYITDAISGIYHVMLKADHNRAFNLANEQEPIAIKDLARQLQDIADHGKSIIFETEVQDQTGYTKYKRTALNTDRLQSLGWSPAVRLKEGLKRTLRSFE